jgi:hypothetical protein
MNSILEYISNNNKLDLESLNNFFLEKNDSELDFLLQVKEIKEITNYSSERIHDYFLELLFSDDAKDYIPEIIPEILWLNYEFCNKVILERPDMLQYINKNIENYYSLVKSVYYIDSYLLNEDWFPVDYIPQLMKDFPEDKSDFVYRLEQSLKEYISKEVKKLLREYYLK